MLAGKDFHPRRPKTAVALDAALSAFVHQERNCFRLLLGADNQYGKIVPSVSKNNFKN